MNHENHLNAVRDQAVLSSLCCLLKKNGNKILIGDSKLAITTECLSMLGSVFLRLGGDIDLFEETISTCRTERQNHWKTNAEFLENFFSKTPALKIMHTSATLLGGIQIDRFRALRVLEMKKVPVHLVEGLQKLRGQLICITVSRSLQNLQHLFELCGGDMSAPMIWPELKSAYLSFNGIEILDGSLRLLPSLQVLDLSHNNLQTTDKYLEYLTELERLNIGFNFLDELPSFSLSAKAKLKTLVLRNNNLDNIEGLEEMPLLEDLDISENCFCDHSNLQPLINLNKLRRICTVGNPIYQHKNHRNMTLCHISQVALQKQFELDGKSLSTSESNVTLCTVQHSSISISRRPSSMAHNAIVHQEGHPQTSNRISSEYSFHDSDNIATSLPVRANIHQKPKKRTRLKPTDLDSSTDALSRESSRASSPVRSGNLDNHDVIKTQQEVELLRDHYGPNWLQAIGDKFQNSSNEEDSDINPISTNQNGVNKKQTNQKDPNKKQTNQKDPNKKQTNQKDPNKKQTNQKDPTDDDLYLKETRAGTSILVKADVVSHDVLQSRSTLDDVDCRCEVDDEDDVTVSDSMCNYLRSDSGIDWTQTTVEEENKNVYGEESEPFIVLVVEKNYEQLIVTTNNRFLIEKDLNGVVVEQLDLRMLLRVQRYEEVVVHPDVQGNIIMSHLKLMFDYVRKDRKERVYVMEDETYAEEFENLLRPFLEERELKSLSSVVFQCLKCSHHFNKDEAQKLSDHQKMPSSGSTLDLENLKTLACIRYHCPKCHSDKVIAVERSSGSQPSSSTSTPVGSYSSGNYMHHAKGAEVSKKQSPIKVRPSSLDTQGMLKSPLAKSTPQKQNGDISDNDQTRRRINKNITKDFAVEGNSKPRSDAVISQNADNAESQSTARITIPRETSWSELQETLKKEKRVRIASVDSDITVLTNPSESSISVISETSSEDITRAGGVRLISDDAQISIMESIIGDGSHIMNKEELTPMGSPLSNSICSSMVSSVYQNSVIATGDVTLTDDVTPTDDITVTDDVTVADDVAVADDVTIADDVKMVDDLTKDKQMEINKFLDDDIAINGSVKKKKSIYDVTESSDVTEQSRQPLSRNDYVDQCCEKSELESSNEADNSMVSRERSSAILEQPFTDIDHQLKLYLVMSLFEDSEEFECIFRCDMVQYLIEEEFKGIFIMTSAKFYILKVEADASSENPADWLKTVDIQPVPELRYIDMGLGCQSFRLEYRTECSSYDFIVRDEQRCKKFVDFLEVLIDQNPVHELYKKLDVAIHKDINPTSLDRLHKQVLRHSVEGGNSLVKYLMGYLVRGHNPLYPISFVISNSEICLVRENHQWPQPRLQAPLTEKDTGKHFTVLERQAINNIATIEICEKEKRRIRVTFFNEKSGDETNWQITMETSNGTQSLVQAIKTPWETAFGVDLDVAMVTFDE